MRFHLFNTFRNKLLVFIIFIIIILSSTSFLSFYFSKASSNQYKDMIKLLYQYNDLSNYINGAVSTLEDYIKKDSSDTKKSYNTDIEECLKIVNHIASISDSEEMYYQVIGLKSLIQTFDDNNQELIKIVDSKDGKNFLDDLMNSKRLYNYINDKIVKLNTRQIVRGNDKYEDIVHRVEVYGIIIILITAGIFLLSVLFSIGFTNIVASPVKKLTRYAKEISTGNFDIEDIQSGTTEEISILTSVLNTMKCSIKRMIEEIKEKGLIEAKLQEKEVENLKIANALKSAELKMLQSQINPHFLFNTLNSISRMAYLEGSENVVKLIEAVSDMLRYNIRKNDKPETLEGEIQNLKRYIFIQETRFSGKLKVNLNVSTANSSLPIPCLTLQPLVENSIVHGLQQYDYNGTVSINVYDMDSKVFIDIIDNGIGMDEVKMADIFHMREEYDSQTSTGIGIRNVVSRMKAFYKSDDCFEIESNLGEGTRIRLKLCVNAEKEAGAVV